MAWLFKLTRTYRQPRTLCGSLYPSTLDKTWTRILSMQLRIRGFVELLFESFRQNSSFHCWRHLGEVFDYRGQHVFTTSAGTSPHGGLSYIKLTRDHRVSRTSSQFVQKCHLSEGTTPAQTRSLSNDVSVMQKFSLHSSSLNSWRTTNLFHQPSLWMAIQGDRVALCRKKRSTVTHGSRVALQHQAATLALI